MKTSHLDEPRLEFADGEHVDIRAGITNLGALDRDSSRVPNPIRVGIVGASACVDGICKWLEMCADGVVSPEPRYRDLRPDFPGMTETTFGTRLDLSEQAQRVVSGRELAAVLSSGRDVRPAVTLFMEHARDVALTGKADVIVIAPPAEIFGLSDPKPRGELELDEGSEDKSGPYQASFHNLFKAEALDLPVPCQIVRPDTYGGGRTRGARKRASLQDVSTRAWNFHTALYYKAGAVPWRLERSSSAFTTLFVGVSFFRTADRIRMLTSIAQVFDERGEGVVVQGAHPQINKEDRSPHLTATDATALLADALACYRREHRTAPARLVVHKTSYFDDQEIAGFKYAADDANVEFLELISLRRSGIRLYREGNLPVLRGTTATFEDGIGIIYLRGSVPQFRMYPGLYVPNALEFTHAAGESSALTIAEELLCLSKLNFNSTQFDGGEPITVRAARRVGDILKHVRARDAKTRPTRLRYLI